MTRISFTDSWFGVTTAAPPQAWLIAVTPSSWKLFASTRWPFALIGTWFSVPKTELFEPPGPCWLGTPTELPAPSRAPRPKTPGARRTSS